MIIADTGAMVALIDADDRHHAALADIFRRDPTGWIVPWAVLPEVDHVVRSRLGEQVARAFLADLADGAFRVEWGESGDLARAGELDERYADLGIGLVDAVVMATAERLGADAVATLDIHDFGAVEIEGAPKLLPRDLPAPG